jgi:hypothetical protein
VEDSWLFDTVLGVWDSPDTVCTLLVSSTAGFIAAVDDIAVGDVTGEGYDTRVDEDGFEEYRPGNGLALTTPCSMTSAARDTAAAVVCSTDVANPAPPEVTNP